MRLLCNGQQNPLGVDSREIRLSFTATVAYRFAEIRIEGGECYRLTMDEPPQVRLQGLLPGRVYNWQVLLHLPGGQIQQETASFETLPELRYGRWIAPPQNDGSVQQFTQRVSVTETEGHRLYICGLGYFNATVNGHPVDDTFYKPLVTDYGPRTVDSNPDLLPNHGHRVTCYTYDISSLLVAGENELTVSVALGYYANDDRRDEEPDFSYGEPRLFFEWHRSGELIAASAAGCPVCGTGVTSTLYYGDRVDFRPTDKPTMAAVELPPPGGQWTSPMMEDDRIGQVLPPLTATQTADGLLLDFGINHAGGLLMTAAGRPGDELTVRFAEVLKPDGTPNWETSAWHGWSQTTNGPVSIYQEAHYTLSGGEDAISPQFSWMCYRYALITCPETVVLKDIRSAFIHSDVKASGDFRCAERTLNTLHEQFVRTQRCNMHSGLITDCPHREKRPYTGDGRLTMAATMYTLDAEQTYRKWLTDILDSQQENGLVPNSAPYLGGGGGYAWTNALCAVPETLYDFTGDLQVVEDSYPAVRRLLAYYAVKRDADFVIRRNGHQWMLGDWLAPDTVTSDVFYISTVCYLRAVRTAKRFAELIAPADVAKMAHLQTQIEEAIVRVFFHPGQLTFGNGVQGENVLALAFGLVPPDYVDAMRQKVEQHYRVETDYHLDTGIVLTPIVIKYLTDTGLADIAWRLMTQTTAPSFAAMMDGETTLCEHWSRVWPDYYTDSEYTHLVEGGGDVSHCHPMLGAVVDWLYERVAGLDLSRMGHREMAVRPLFTAYLPSASAEKQTVYGKAEVSWQSADSELTMTVTVPMGMTARCRFPHPAETLFVGDETVQQADGWFDFPLSGGTWTIRSEGVKTK